VPEAFSVSALCSSSSKVSGGLTPAVSKRPTLYQTVDLLAALKRKP
jgi:hypothetical protein